LSVLFSVNVIQLKISVAAFTVLCKMLAFNKKLGKQNISELANTLALIKLNKVL
jgi:hypothetical protein